jgi:CHAD domain-containing protein
VKTAPKTTGLRYWMLRVLDECDHVAADFSADPVHDLRVALRRCRSMADGLRAMDPDPAWKAMKKAGKSLFQRLGELRDVQIMMEWTEKLYPIPAPVGARNSLAPSHQEPGLTETIANSTDTGSVHHARDPVAHALLQVLAAREDEHKREA